jgi:hypothetical protein
MEMREEIKSGQAEIRSVVNAWIADMKNWKETMSCQVTAEACLNSQETNKEDMEPKVEHREVPTEETAVESSGTMKKRYRGRHLVAGWRGEPKELSEETLDPGGSWLLPAGRYPIMQQWYGARETSSGKFGPREIVDCGSNWPQPAGK